ncbi:hypothetical protein CDAR_563671 [Caerostris darwini]|uniref:Uncharacterized protein n=1 Tax=Caerostris darwini TaxID=1538125 RepID=A0AAV4VDF5_9ARAC|nr:hypothetical protein CDAR_563671 [Caerostris darwini]
MHLAILVFEDKVHAYAQQKVHHDLMNSGGKSVSELDNSREDHSLCHFLVEMEVGGRGETLRRIIQLENCP